MRFHWIRWKKIMACVVLLQKGFDHVYAKDQSCCERKLSRKLIMKCGAAKGSVDFSCYYLHPLSTRIFSSGGRSTPDKKWWRWERPPVAPLIANFSLYGSGIKFSDCEFNCLLRDAKLKSSARFLFRFRFPRYTPFWPQKRGKSLFLKIIQRLGVAGLVLTTRYEESSFFR